MYIGGHTVDVIIKDNEISIEDEVKAEFVSFSISCTYQIEVSPDMDRILNVIT